MAIQVYTNERLIENRTRIGRWTTLISLFVILASVAFVLIYNDLPLAYGLMIGGLILSSIGGFFFNRWGVGAYKRIEDSLKGFDKRYRLYNYLLPAPHVMLTPYGVTVFLVKNQEGKIAGTEKGWKQNAGFLGALRAMTFSTVPLDDPPKELAAQVDAMRKFIADGLGTSLDVPIEGFILFTNERAEVTLTNVKAPVIIMNKQPDGLKNALRRDKRTPALAPQVYNQVQALFDRVGDEKLEQAEREFRFWQK